MEEVLAEVGLSNGFLIPAADSNNVALELEIKELQRQREDLVSHQADQTGRLSVVKKHVYQLHEEQTENRKLLFEYECQIASEDSSTKLWESQVRSLHGEEVDVSRGLQQLKDREDKYRVESGHVVARLEQHRAQAEWDQHALLTWASAAARVADDHAILEEFSVMDSAKFEHLELKRQHCRKEVDSKRGKFEKINGDILSLEQSLEKLGSIFQSQQQDRQALVDQWHASSQVLHQRDDDIRKAMEDVGGLRTQAKLRMRELNEHKTFYLNEQRNNREAERDLVALTHETQNTAATCHELGAVVADLTGQLSITRASLTSAARQVQTLRNTCRRLAEEIYRKRTICVELEEHEELLVRQIQETDGQRCSAEGRARQLEGLRVLEEAACHRLLNEHNKLQEKIRLISEELVRLQAVERDQRNCMAGLEATSNALKQRTIAAHAEQKRQEEILYKAEVNYLDKDLQLKRMLGRADPENIERCEQNLKVLESEMAKTKDDHLLLQRENYRLDQEYRRVVSALERDHLEQKTIRCKKQELVLEVEGGEKRVLIIRNNNQDRQVDENLIRLRVCHLKKALNRVGGQLYTLERQRLELEEAVQERAMEVNAKLDELNIQKRALGEQLSNLNANINGAKLKVDHLRSKHMVTIQSLGSTDTGEAMSATLLKIMAAQERYELQQEGDKLDARIRTTEREITAMENTLLAVNAANCTYKSSLSRVAADGPELQEMAALEAAYVASVEMLRGKRAVVKELEEACTRLRDALQAQLEEEANLLKEAGARAGDVTEIGRRLEAQNEKQNRAARELKSLLKQIHGIQKQDYQSIEEKDMILREVRDQNQAALEQLSEVAGQVLETYPVVNQYLRERGLALPQPSARRSVASSRGSSLIASSSCVTIDSSTLGEVKADERKHRRQSILKSEKKKVLSENGTKSTGNKSRQSIDIVDFIVPTPK